MIGDETIKHLLSRQNVSRSLDEAYRENMEDPIRNTLSTTVKAKLVSYFLLMLRLGTSHTSWQSSFWPWWKARMQLFTRLLEKV